MNPSPRDMVHQGKINLVASVETVSTQQFPSRVVLTYAIVNIAQQNSDSKTVKAQLIAEISDTDRKDHNGRKILHQAATLLDLKQGSVHYQAVLRQQTNIREGFTNDPRTRHTKRGVLHDPATHHTSEGLSYMTRTAEPQKNSQPKVSLEHYVGHPTQLSYS